MTRFVYIHVPKCGGSSFGAALRLRFMTSQARVGFWAHKVDSRLKGEARIVADYALRKRELHELMRKGKRCISGHVHADYSDIRDRGYQWITLLRAPEERFVSHYHYLQRHHPDPMRPNTLSAFLDTADAARIASQYLFYFAGRSQYQSENLNSDIARAIETLHCFSVVGDLADTTQFKRAVEACTGRKLLSLNRNRAPEKTAVPHSLRPRIRALCAVDRSIYEAALHQRCAA